MAHELKCFLLEKCNNINTYLEPSFFHTINRQVAKMKFNKSQIQLVYSQQDDFRDMANCPELALFQLCSSLSLSYSWTASQCCLLLGR